MSKLLNRMTTAWIVSAVWFAFALVLNCPILLKENYLPHSAKVAWPLVDERSLSSLDELITAPSGALFARVFSIGWPVEYLRQTFPTFSGPTVGFEIDYWLLSVNILSVALIQIALAYSARELGALTIQRLLVCTLVVAVVLAWMRWCSIANWNFPIEQVLLAIYFAPLAIALATASLVYTRKRQNQAVNGSSRSRPAC